MIDGTARKMIQPGLDRAGQWLANRGVKADHVTVFACCLGLVAGGLIATGYMIAALLAILVSRVCDGLDGSVARATKKTDFGGYLDITLDFVFYGAIPLAFVIHDPAANGLARRGVDLLVLHQWRKLSCLRHPGRKAPADHHAARG